MGGFGGVINSEHKQESFDNRAGASENAILTQGSGFVYNGSSYSRYPSAAVVAAATSNPLSLAVLSVVILGVIWFFFFRK